MESDRTTFYANSMIICLRFVILTFCFCREGLHCLVEFVEEKGFTYASCAKGTQAYTGHLCMILLLLILAFVLLVMVIG